MRKNSVFAGAGGAAVLLFCALALLYRPVATYLLHLEPAAIYQLAISVGAALIGLIGVVFTLTLFVVQQVSNNSVPGLLREYAADRGTQLIYAALTSLAVLALASALINPVKHPFAPVFLIAFAVLGALTLLWALFQRVVRLSDPSNVIQHLQLRALEELQSLEDLRVALLETNPGLARERVSFNQDPNVIPVALGTLRHHNPSLTDGMERYLRQLYALVRRLASEQQTDLFREAIYATTNVLVQYVDYHGRNIPMPNGTTFMFSIPIGQDRILANALDLYASASKAAVPSADVEMSKATLGGLAAIALKSVHRSPLNKTHGENGTAGIVLGTMIEVVQFFTTKGHIEGVFSSFTIIAPVLKELAKAGFYQTAQFGISKVAEMCQLCLVAKQPILAMEGAASLLGVVAFSIDNSVRAGDISGTCVKELFSICAMQLEVEPLATRAVSFDVGRTHPISRIFGIGDDTLVGFHLKSIQIGLAALKANDDSRWQHIAHFLREFHDRLAMRMAELAARCPNKQHMLLYWLETSALSFARQLLTLWYQLGKLIEGQEEPGDDEAYEQQMQHYRRVEYREEISEKLSSFVVFFYSRSSTFHANGALSDAVVGCYESVVSIASDATFIGATDVGNSAAEMLRHSARAAMDKHGYAAVDPSCRFVGRLLETALLARVKQDTRVLASAEETIRQTFQRCVALTVSEQERHSGFHLDDPARLLTSRLRDYVRGERDFLFEEKSRTFAQNVSRAAAQEYLDYINARFAEWLANPA